MSITFGQGGRGPVKITSSGTLTAKQDIVVNKIRWVNPAATTDTAVITDGTDTLWEAQCSVAKQGEDVNFVRKPLQMFSGGTWTFTISSGTLYLYIE